MNDEKRPTRRTGEGQPNCSLCKWYQDGTASDICVAQGFEYTTKVYNTESCNKLYEKKAVVNA